MSCKGGEGERERGLGICGGCIYNYRRSRKLELRTPTLTLCTYSARWNVSLKSR